MKVTSSWGWGSQWIWLGLHQTFRKGTVVAIDVDLSYSMLRSVMVSDLQLVSHLCSIPSSAKIWIFCVTFFPLKLTLSQTSLAEFNNAFEEKAWSIFTPFILSLTLSSNILLLIGSFSFQALIFFSPVFQIFFFLPLITQFTTTCAESSPPLLVSPSSSSFSFLCVFYTKHNRSDFLSFTFVCDEMPLSLSSKFFVSTLLGTCNEKLFWLETDENVWSFKM